MKLCKDCIHYRWSPFGQEMARCNAVWKTDDRSDLTLVNGQLPKAVRAFCDLERSPRYDILPRKCGSTGKLWQPKPRPWWAFWRPTVSA